MKKIIGIFSILAIIQIVMIVMTWTTGSELKTYTKGSSLLSFEVAKVDSLTVKDKENEVQLNKQDGKWALADGFPAAKTKVNVLLEKLSGLKCGLPVATSAQALSRFNVAENSFTRYLRLQSHGKTVAELYLGTGAGARQSHVRNGEQNVVFTASLGSYDLPVKPEPWQDKGILQFDRKDVSSLVLNEVKLLRKPAVDRKKQMSPLWQGESLPQDTQINQQVVNEILTKFATLRFTKILGNSAQPEYGLSEPLLTAKFTLSDGNRSYKLGKIKDSENFCLNVSNRDEFFQLPSTFAKGLLEQIKKVIRIPADNQPVTRNTAETKK